MKTKQIKVIAIIAILVAIVAVVVSFVDRPSTDSVTPNVGAINVEDYVPVIKYEGYNSSKAIVLSGADGDITSGDDITVGDDLTIADDATVTGDFTVASSTTVREFTQGGGQCSITDANGGTYTLTQAELSVCNYRYMTASGAGQETIALTLPATSTLTTLLPSVGDYREWLIDASDLAAATTTTITAGTGIDMIAVTNAEDIIDGGEYSELRCWRKSDTDVACITSELINSD